MISTAPSPFTSNASTSSYITPLERMVCLSHTSFGLPECGNSYQASPAPLSDPAGFPNPIIASSLPSPSISASPFSRTVGGGLGSITIRVKGTRAPLLVGVGTPEEDPKTWNSDRPMFKPLAAVMVNLTQVIDLVANEATKGLLASFGSWPTATAVPSLKLSVPAFTLSHTLGRSQRAIRETCTGVLQFS